MSMQEHGYNRTAEEINTRIKNLKCFYNRVKKDLEMGVINAPSWPHYEAMDEILSRPIFGNNARMSSTQQNQHNSQSSQSSQSPKDYVAHLVEPEIKEENFTDDDDETPRLQIVDRKELLIPKDEPIDGDQAELLDSEIDEDFDEDLEDEQPPLPKLQKISHDHFNDRNSSGVNHLPQLDKIVSRPVELKILDAPAASDAATVISNSPSSTVTNGGKISLVPTNILLKPQLQYGSSNNALQQQPQTIQTNQTISNNPPKTPNNASSQGMKVLFVNALANAANSNNSQTTNSSQNQQQQVLNNLPKLQPKPVPALHPTTVTPKIVGHNSNNSSEKIGLSSSSDGNSKSDQSKFFLY